jgi:nucleotide-binding universal stress UspA family protein
MQQKSFKGREMLMNIHTILVPTDFSEYSDKAFSWALEMAEKWDAKLTLLHIVPTPNYPPMMIADGGFNPVDFESSLVADAEKQAKEMASRVDRPDISIETKVLVGSAFHDICKIAEQDKSDLIVMGSHGRTGLSHVFLGSVAERVVRHAPCPVLVVGKKAES